ncbi:hypothetical protein pb186bvf_021154 [Paramecium bursaria]
MLHFLLEIGNSQQLDTEFYAEFQQTEQTKLPLEQLQYNNDYIICLRFKLKPDVDYKKADEDFKGICKSLWVLLGSFVPMFRLHLKSAFTPQFQVIDGWAYVNLRYTNKDDAENLNLINQLINEYLSQNQKDEQVLFSLKSDISVDKFLEELDFSKFTYLVAADGKIQKNTHEIIDNLLKISFKDNLKNLNGKFIEFVVLYYQLLVKGSFELKFDRLDELSKKIKLKQIKLPIKIPVFKKIKLFSEQYQESQIEFNYYCKHHQFNTGFKYQGNIMDILDKIIIMDK